MPLPLRSACPFCSGVSGLLGSKVIPRPLISSLKAVLKDPSLSERMNTTSRLNLYFILAIVFKMNSLQSDLLR